MNKNKKFSDISARLQIYLEGVKNYQTARQNEILNKLQGELFSVILSFSRGKLGDLSKTELNKLILTLRKSQNKVFNLYVQRMLNDLERFTKEAFETYSIVWASASENNFAMLSLPAALAILSKGNRGLYGFAMFKDEDRYSKLLNAIMPANGLSIKKHLEAFEEVSKASIENKIRKAWANKQAVEEVLSEIGDEKRTQGAASEIKKIKNNSKAAIATAIQQAAIQIDSGIQSIIFDFYIWDSIIDDSTTDICIKRNKKRFKYGEGPLPPAHINCRSGTHPYDDGDLGPPESFYKWLQRQPDLFKRYSLGSLYAKFQNGEIAPDELKKLLSFGAISPSQFSKRELIKNVLDFNE